MILYYFKTTFILLLLLLLLLLLHESYFTQLDSNLNDDVAVHQGLVQKTEKPVSIVAPSPLAVSSGSKKPIWYFNSNSTSSKDNGTGGSQTSQLMKCTLPGCTSSFSTSSELKQHLRHCEFSNMVTRPAPVLASSNTALTSGVAGFTVLNTGSSNIVEPASKFQTPMVRNSFKPTHCL